MSGMNSDRVFTTVAKKGLQQFKHRERNPDSVVLGGVIIGVQCTQYDNLACLRIFAKIDLVMDMLLTRLGIETPTCVPAHLTISSLSKHRPAEHQFLVPYDNMGSLCPELMSRGVEALMVLDLTPGKRVRLTSGPYEGDTGEVIEVSSQGMYQIQFNHEIDKKTKVWYFYLSIFTNGNLLMLGNILTRFGNFLCAPLAGGGSRRLWKAALTVYPL